MDIRKKILTILPYVLIPLLIITGGTIFSTYQKQEKTEYYQLIEYFNDGLIPEYTLNLSNGSFEYKLKGTDGKTTDKQLTVPDVEMFMNDIHPKVIQYNRENPKSLIKAKYVSGSAGTWLWNLLPTALLLVAIVLLFLFMTRRMNQTMTSETNRAMSFGKAKVKNAKDEKRKTTFDDVAGAEEEKEELMEIVEYLKAPSKFDTLGARIPKGVLLVGPPGTGKTLLGRAVAGEAGVPFLSISGADFVEMYVGVGASRVRDLFEQAKKNAPSIIFIDEIDAVGRHRGAGMGGGHDEREQTLNQLLVEMDGFGINEGVIILAATNRPDILDPALLRPGRFDRQVVVGYPDKKGREAILKVHARGKPLAPDVDLSVIAGTTVGFTGADLENLLNESALLAARRDKKAITMEEIEEATIKVLVGGEKKSRKMSDKEKKLTAYHEAGHAVATFYLDGQDPVHQVSIIPRGLAGGFTLHLPKEDKSYASMKEMLDSLVVLMGGRVSEALALDDISTGASNDIARATKTARDMVTKYGMSGKLGPVSFANENDEVFFGRDYSHIRNYSESVASEIDEEVNRIISDAYDRAGAIMNEHMDKLHKVAARLLEAEKIDGEEFIALMRQDSEETETQTAGNDTGEQG